MSALLHFASSNAPLPKDVVIATTGASAALGGLVLVFLGLVIASYQALPADTPREIKERRKRPAWPVLVLFCFCAVSVTLGFVWLEGGAGNALYAANNVVFAAELVGIVGVAVCTARQMLG